MALVGGFGIAIGIVVRCIVAFRLQGSGGNQESGCLRRSLGAIGHFSHYQVLMCNRKN